MRHLFMDCELDVLARSLKRADHVIHLEPKAFDLLVYLIQHRERVVRKDELFTQLWPGQFITDAALSRCILLVRKALGGAAPGRRAIQTYHRVGFRFVSAVAIEERRPIVTEPRIDSNASNAGFVHWHPERLAGQRSDSGATIRVSSGLNQSSIKHRRVRPS
jgi:DNA-binding winged helix-turn-helix (wHTH) protein